MEEIRGGKEGHRIVLYDRRTGQLSGVKNVRSFDLNEIVLDTEMGVLTITGSELHLGRLNLEKGEVDLEGVVEGFHYTDKDNFLQSKESLIKRIFR